MLTLLTVVCPHSPIMLHSGVLGAGAALLALVLVYAFSYIRWRARTKGLPLPPSPPLLPLAGALRYMATPEYWRVFRDLGKTYGKNNS